MSRARTRQFHCQVVNETVQIHLRMRRGLGFSGTPSHFVQCNQADCQYVDENTPPCPLTLEMFADEIAELEERRRSRRDQEDEGW
jgi:hypothetical protein